MALKSLFGLFFLILSSCTTNYNVLSPSFAGVNSACAGQAFSAVVCPGQAIRSAQGSIVLSGSNLLIDAYSSTVGAYGGANRLAVGNVKAGSSLVISGSGVTITGSQISGSPYLEQSVAPPVPTSGNWVISASSTSLTLTAGDYYFNNIAFSGSNLTISTPSGQVRIWFDNLAVSGSNTVLGTTKASDLWLIGTCDAKVAFSGTSGTLRGVIFNPAGPIAASGLGWTVFGAIVGNDIALSGSNQSLHRDLALCGY